MDPPPAPVIYICGGCSQETTFDINSQHPPKCEKCKRCTILYKKRTTKPVMYEAR